MKKWNVKRIVAEQTKLFTALLVVLNKEDVSDEWTDIGGEG